MSLQLGQKLRIRAMTYVAGEPISFFWPMRTFIHHNPLHAFEHLPFEDALRKGERLFHGRVFLPRALYQGYMQQGKIDMAELTNMVAAFVQKQNPIDGVRLQDWLMALLTRINEPIVLPDMFCAASDIAHVLNHSQLTATDAPDTGMLATRLRNRLLDDCLVYEAVDSLYGTDIGVELNELVIKTCLDFFDEGQSVFAMPGRKLGFFRSWREVARRNARLFLRGLHIKRILDVDDTPEGIIAHVMNTLEVPESNWVGYFTRELASLHGWAGFVRWRSNARHYYWNERYPADLVDLLAIRLTFGLALLSERGRKHIPMTAGHIANAIQEKTRETWLRYELHSGNVLPAFAQQIEQTLARGNVQLIDRTFTDYTRQKSCHEAQLMATRLTALAHEAQAIDVLPKLSSTDLSRLLRQLREFEQHEGLIWLHAMEAHAMRGLLKQVELEAPPARDKRPFVQALFCIDTRSERIRRHLESVGDYQTFGIAGFFGVPISFMELGKGSETHLCPVLLTPKNLVIEMSVAEAVDMHPVTALERILHDLKESVFSPFVTVEAIGLLFGFDMVGKTLMPQTYNRWRKRLYQQKPSTHLLLDKLSREQADSIVRAAQRAVIVRAVEQEFKIEAERINDDLVRELREAALGHETETPELIRVLGLNKERAEAFIQRLRNVYRIDPAYAQLQMEKLARIGFSLDEQVGFVSQALRAIGLTRDFSRFILLVGHGSMSENNPYESAIDCGACGGNRGVVNARALAQMANNSEVRIRLRAQGIDIAADAWFIPALHNTTTDELQLFDLDRMPSSHVLYIDRLRNGLLAASRLCAQERLPSLQLHTQAREPAAAFRKMQRRAMDWSQVRPEWGLSRNAYFIIGRRHLTRRFSLEGRAFLHSYDYRLDPKRRLLENILTGPLVVGQWINMEHYFSTVDNDRFGSGSKVYHNVAGRFGVMTGNLSDLRTGLPAQTVLSQGLPYHQPMRLITIIEAPQQHTRRAVEDVAAVKNLVRNGWIRLVIIDPEQASVCICDNGQWQSRPLASFTEQEFFKESATP